jgi:hypothetical protein
MTVKYRIAIATLALLVLFPFSSRSQQSNGTYGFLDATNSARVAALGGTSLAINDGDIQLGIYNPSLINSEINNNLALSYVDYFNSYIGVNYATAQYGRSFEKLGNFIGTVQYHNYGKFSATSESGESEGTFSPSDFSLMIGWGRQFGDRWSIGANFKYAGLQYEAYSAGAVAVDVAGSYYAENGWNFSLVARNVGMELFNNFDNQGYALPFKLEASMSKRLEHLPVTLIVVYDDIQKWNKVYDDPLDLEGNYDPLTGVMVEDNSVEKFTKNLLCHFVVGGELNLGKNLVIRGAYNCGRHYDMKVPQSRALVGFSYGVGVKIKMMEISYSRSRLNITGSPNYISVIMDLDKFSKKK